MRRCWEAWAHPVLTALPSAPRTQWRPVFSASLCTPKWDPPTWPGPLSHSASPCPTRTLPRCWCTTAALVRAARASGAGRARSLDPNRLMLPSPTQPQRSPQRLCVSLCTVRQRARRGVGCLHAGTVLLQHLAPGLAGHQANSGTAYMLRRQGDMVAQVRAPPRPPNAPACASDARAVWRCAVICVQYQSVEKGSAPLHWAGLTALDWEQRGQPSHGVRRPRRGYYAQ